MEKVLLSNGDASSGNLNLVGGAIRVHGADGRSRVSNLIINSAHFEMVPQTGMIVDGSNTTFADVRNAVLGGWYGERCSGSLIINSRLRMMNQGAVKRFPPSGQHQQPKVRFRLP